jgi:hypothetical protein
MQQDLVSSCGDPDQLRAWLADNRELCALLKKHGLQMNERPEWSAMQRAAALEAMDAMPKAIRRAEWTSEQRKQQSSAGRQGQARINLLVRQIDALLGHKQVAESQCRGSTRNDLLAYLRGADHADTWRILAGMLNNDLRLAVRLRDYCDYSLSDALIALQPSGLSERVEWLLETKRFRGRYRLTAERERALLDLRKALQSLRPNARAGRPEAASKPLLRAAVILWKTFDRPMEFTFGRPAISRRSLRTVTPKLSGDIIDFVRDLFTLAKLPQPTDAALSQMLRALRSV